MTSVKPLPLPHGLEESYVDCTDSCGLVFHVISAGQKDKPLILLTHGFPEIAFSWRKIMPALAAQGYYVVAPDQRGYGRTTGWDTRAFHEVDLNQFTMTNLVRDLVCLVYALGYKEVRCHVGHDFGAVSSSMAPLMRPDIFKSCIQMSHPHHAPPTPAFGVETSAKPVKHSLQNSIRLESTTSGTIQLLMLRKTGRQQRKDCTSFFEDTFMSNQSTGMETIRSLWNRGLLQNWRRCHTTTSCQRSLACRKQYLT
jgi:pimeloyl-ACP methyl ester carboxylesterase